MAFAVPGEPTQTSHVDNSQLTPPKKWVPKIRTGFFYVGDRQYYLFEKKATCYLAEITWTRLRLAAVVDPATITVYFRGIEVSAEAYRVDGPYIEVNHSRLYTTYPGKTFNELHLDVDWHDPVDLGIEFAPDDTIRVVGTGKYSVTGSGTFTSVVVDQYIPLYDGERIYRFDVIPERHAPVVITDDSLYSWDGRQFSPQFSIDYSTGELTFNAAKQLLYNSFFDNGTDYWMPIGGGIGTISQSDAFYGEIGRKPYIGLFMMQFDVGTGVGIKQRIRVEETRPHAFNTLVRAVQAATVYLTFRYYDVTNTLLGTDTDSLFLPAGSDWTKIHKLINRYNQVRNPDYEMPAGTYEMEIELTHDGNSLDVDHICLYESHLETDLYTPNPLSTVEFEVGTGLYYTHYHELIWDHHGRVNGNLFVQEEINVNPMFRVFPVGFIYFYEFDGVADYGLGHGGLLYDTESESFIQTRGRKHVPYAKTSGIGKLTQVGYFDLWNPAWTEEAVHVARYPEVVVLDLEGQYGEQIKTTSTTINTDAAAGDRQLSVAATPIPDNEGYVLIGSEAFRFTRDGNTFNIGSPLVSSYSSGENVTFEHKRLRVFTGDVGRILVWARDENGTGVGQMDVKVTQNNLVGTVNVDLIYPKTDPDGLAILEISGSDGSSCDVIVQVGNISNGMEVGIFA